MKNKKATMDTNGSDLLSSLKDYSQKFINDREWSKFHSPKNVAIGVSVEAAELLEIFQWLTEEQSFAMKDDPETLQKVQDEAADIFHFLIRLSSVLDFDLIKAFWRKMKQNESKYPAQLCKGGTKKYSELCCNEEG